MLCLGVVASVAILCRDGESDTLPVSFIDSVCIIASDMETDSAVYLTTKQFDELFIAIPVQNRIKIEVGGAIVGIVAVLNNTSTRIFRGDPRQWGTMQRRLAFGDFDPSAIGGVGSGRLGQEAAAELRAEALKTNRADYGPPTTPGCEPMQLTPRADVLNSNPMIRDKFEQALKKAKKLQREAKKGTSKKTKRKKSKSRTK